VEPAGTGPMTRPSGCAALATLAALAILALAELGVCIAFGVQLARTNDLLSTARRANADLDARLTRSHAELAASREALRFELNTNENLRGNARPQTPILLPARSVIPVAVSSGNAEVDAARTAQRRAEQQRDDLRGQYRSLRDEYDAQTKVLFRLQNELMLLQRRIDRLRGKPPRR
jgi:chromosome segregation ATPase